MKRAVLLMNVGTPDSPSVKDVRRYLFQFLNDRRVIDIPWILQKILVNLIIVPFRAPKSAKLYQRLWTEKGSPLLFHGLAVRDKLQMKLSKNEKVFFAMRYGNPSYRDVLNEIKKERFSEIIVVPLFPHYASSSTGTAIAAVLGEIRIWGIFPKIKVVNQFYNNELYINAFVSKIKSYQPEKYDHVVFSYHGLPIRHITKIHPEIDCTQCTCTKELPLHGEFCYKATCYETSRLIAAKLNLSQSDYSVSFQSRLSNNWLQPFTDKLLIEKAKAGVKRILIVSPAFVADCLETTIELGYEYAELFEKNGGEKLQYVESLNDMDEWIDALRVIVQS